MKNLIKSKIKILIYKLVSIFFKTKVGKFTAEKFTYLAMNNTKQIIEIGKRRKYLVIGRCSKIMYGKIINILRHNVTNWKPEIAVGKISLGK